MAFGFKNPKAMIALTLLNLGGYCPPLQGVKPPESTHGTSGRAKTTPHVPRVSLRSRL